KTNTPWEAPRFFKSIDVHLAERNSFHRPKFCVTQEADGDGARLFLGHHCSPIEKPATAGPGGLWVGAARHDLVGSRLHASSQQNPRGLLGSGRDLDHSLTARSKFLNGVRRRRRKQHTPICPSSP